VRYWINKLVNKVPAFIREDRRTILHTARNSRKPAHVVMHIVSPSPTKATGAEFQAVNAEGTRNVIESCRKKDVKALISSTCAVFQGFFK
jgi:nucleoside-diphosphate-sugar epimerase